MCCTQAAQAQDKVAASSNASAAVTVPGLRLSPGLRVHPTVEGNTPAFLEGERIDGDPSGRVVLSGKAQIRRSDMVLKGDRIDYEQNSGQLDAQGDVRLRRDASLITGSRLRYNVDSDTGEVEAANFWLGSQGGSGRAEHAEIFSRSRMRLNKVVYTGCPCPNSAWEIRASRVDLDFDGNEGVARNAVLFFKGVPILASPYLTFPVKQERKSGLLMPTYGVTSNSGFEVSTPYYLNLAPNYDATLTPRYLAKRGLQLGGEFRYLGLRHQGQVSGTYLGRDQDTGDKRWLYSAQHYHVLNHGFYSDWNVSGTSDNDYFRDFSSLGLNESTTTQLSKRFRLGWSGHYMRGYAQIHKYQTLFDSDATVRNPLFDTEPELVWQANRYDWGGVDAELDSSMVWFRKPMGEQRIGGSWQDRRFAPNGQRLAIYPSLSYPVVRAGWYVKPKAGVHYSRYQTRWYANSSRLASDYVAAYQDVYGSPSDGSRSRVQPIFSVDAGMTFDRDASLFGKPMLQTLEPRLYYLRVPYRKQQALPVYDTSLSDFSFAQAFQENIYTGGWDRIANANQLMLGVTTRFLDAGSGFERFTLSGGQRFYFEDQLVTLPYETARTDARSEMLLEATAALTDTLGVRATTQYNPYDRDWDRAMVGLRWRPQRLTTVSASYRYQRDVLTDTGNPVPYLPRGQHQLSLALQWPFSYHWYGVGRIDYSLRRVASTGGLPAEHRRITQAILGLEYKGDCCWTGRVALHRYVVDARDSNTALFFQLELHGLGALGTDPMSMLRRSIPGYQTVTPPQQAATSFERYE